MIDTENATKVISNLNLRDRVIEEIIKLVNVLNIKELDGWEDISFANIDSLRNQLTITTEDLFVLRGSLDNRFEEMLYQMYLEEYYIQ